MALPDGYKSRAQWRFFFAKAKTDPRFAKLAEKEAEKTPGGPVVRYRRLPDRVGAPTARTTRKG